MTSREIQALIDQTPENGTVELPPGVHTIDAPLMISRGRVIRHALFNVTCDHALIPVPGDPMNGAGATLCTFNLGAGASVAELASPSRR